MSIAVSGGLVYVANDGPGGRRATRTTPASRSTPAATCGRSTARPSRSRTTRSPATSCSTATGRGSSVPLVNSSQIDSFTVGSDGLLTAAAGSPFAAQGLGPFGSEFLPTDPTKLFVSNAHNGGTALGTVSAFTDGAGRRAPPIGASPFARPRHRPVLGRDQPRRPVPVHGEHGRQHRSRRSRSRPTDR